MLSGYDMTIMVRLFLCFFCFSLFGLFIGYYIGKKKGITLGMEQLISIIKVYDQKLCKDIGDMLNKVNSMSKFERDTKFKKYLKDHDLME